MLGAAACRERRLVTGARRNGQLPVAYAADAHRLLREIAGRAGARFRARDPHWLGYGPEALARRLTQKLLAEIGVPFRRLFKRRHEAGATETLVAGRFDAESFVVDGRSGEVAITARALLKWTGVFLAYWSYVLAVAVMSLRMRKPVAVPGTLVHGVGHESLERLGDDASFIDFARNGPVTILNEARVLFAQAVQPVNATDAATVRYARYPLLALLRHRGLSPGELLAFLGLHLRAAGAYFIAITGLGAASILARDFAFDAAATVLNRSHAIAGLVLTGSNFTEQMLWMSDLPGRRYPTHMVFYSVNGNPFAYKADPAYEHNPSLSQIRVDTFWVWTPGQAAVVREWGLATPCNVAGPMLFYRPRANAAVRGGTLQIVVFDITPMEPELIERRGVVNPYYTTPRAKAFIADVLAARDAAARSLGRKVKVVLKPKRKYQRVHSTDYIDFLLGRVRSDGDFELLEPQTDLAQVIAASDLVVTLPYSSPPYIAAPLGVPSIYYDPGDELVPTHEAHPLIGFASTPESLARAVIDALADAPHAGAVHARAG